MVEKIGFHGTKKSRGQEILNDQKMKMSRGDDHWLGDGSYFFKDDFWAYWWIREMFKERHLEFYGTVSDSFIEDHYQIIQTVIYVKRERIFDLDDLTHKREFLIALSEIKDKKEYSDKYQECQAAEGLVLNYMFNKLDYHKEFDMVCADFTRDYSNYNGMRLRKNYNSQHQICVKNLDIIETLDEYDFIKHILSYHQLLDTFFSNEGINIYEPDNNDNVYYM